MSISPPTYNHPNPFDMLNPRGYASTAVDAYSLQVLKDAVEKSNQDSKKTIDIKIKPVSNGYVVELKTQGKEVTRIASDMADVGSEIMAAIAQIQLEK